VPTTRPETPADHDAIRRIHTAAFEPSPAEAELVDLLREAGDLVPELCLVATDGEGGEVIGHIAYSEAKLDPGDEPILALAPMGVLPEHQNEGVGTALIKDSLAIARTTSYPLIVVLGHAEYYPRFGFTPGHEHGVACPYEGIPPEAWMALPLPNYDARVAGTVVYPPAFAAVG
jgi:predicted N-acetyltransferase YhbS